jgi:probable F420-dependent oxidoreductase
VGRPRPFRFGIRTDTTSLWEWQEIARKAEAVGFHTLIAQDHFGKQFAPLPALVAAGAVTRRLRLATLVLDNDFRHPATLAKEAATVDVLTSGRLELGLGAGWLQSDYAKTGLAFDPPAERLERLSEAVQICKQFFTSDEAVTFCGKHYRVEQLDASPRPTQKPPPIMLAGRQRRMLSLAAREADIVGISLLDRHVPGQPEPPTFAQKVEWVRQAAGDRFCNLEIHVNARAVEVTDADPHAAIEHIAAQTGQSPAALHESPGTLVGSVEAIVEQLHARRQQYGVSYYVVHARFMDALAPVIARMNGS